MGILEIRNDVRVPTVITFLHNTTLIPKGYNTNQQKNKAREPSQAVDFSTETTTMASWRGISKAVSSRIRLQKHPRIAANNLSLLPISQQSSSVAAPLAQNLIHLAKRWHGGPHVDHEHADSIHVSFLDNEGKKLKVDVDAYVGESLLQVAQRNDIELEGACEGVCACSTCHVIFPDEDLFDSLEEASEDEEDMLDMAYGLTETSRLGCQIIISKDMDGMEIEIPPATRNFYVDG